MNSRLISLIRKEFIQIVRDPRTLALTFIFPILMLFLLGYAATNDVRNIPLIIMDQDRSRQSQDLLNAYRNADTFNMAYTADSEMQIREMIDDGTARAAVIIPPGYGRLVSTGRNAQIAFIVDGSDPTLANTVLASVTLISQSKSTGIITQTLNLRGAQGSANTPVEVRTQVWYNPELVSAYFMIPALIGLILQFLTTILTSTSIVREREIGTIEQLIVTPIRSWELIIGKLTPYVIIAFVDTLEVLIAGVLFFHVPINGSLGLLLLLSALFLTTTLGIGLVVSTVANTQHEAMLTTMFTIMPSIFLSGLFFPLAAMPGILQWISYVVPLRYFLIIARGIILKGVGVESLWREITALSMFAVVIMTIAATRFRKRLD